MKRTEPITEPTYTDCAYAAGFVDGEGSVFVTTSSHRRPDGTTRAGYTAHVVITQQDLAPLRWMQQRWGGFIHPHKSGFSKRPCWRLNVSARQALVLCEDMLPFLQVKQLQAENLIAFQKPRKRGTRGITITEADLAPQREFHKESLRLNQGGAINARS